MHEFVWLDRSMFAWSPWWFLDANDTSVFSSSTSVPTTLLLSGPDEGLPSPVDASQSNLYAGTVKASAPKHLWHLHGCMNQKNQDGCGPAAQCSPNRVAAGHKQVAWPCLCLCVCVCGRTIGGTHQLKALTGFISKCSAGIKRSHAPLVCA